jgi:hypothetical protein
MRAVSSAAAAWACSGGVLLGLLGACLGIGDLARGILAGGADIAVGDLAGLPDFRGCTSADVAYLSFGGGTKFGKFALELVQAGDGLGGGVVGLLAVGACGVAFGLGVPAALDLFGKPRLGRGDALVGAGAGGVHLGLGRPDVTHGAQLGDRAAKGVGVLGGDLLQGVDEFGGAGDAERNKLPAGFLGALAAGRISRTGSASSSSRPTACPAAEGRPSNASSWS